MAVLNETGRPFTARMRNLVDAVRYGDECHRVILVRDGDKPAPTMKGKTSLDTFKKHKRKYIELDAQECITLNALFDTITAIERSLRSQEHAAIILDDFRKFLATAGSETQGQLLEEASKLSFAVERALACTDPGLPSEPPAGALVTL